MALARLSVIIGAAAASWTAPAIASDGGEGFDALIARLEGDPGAITSMQEAMPIGDRQTYYPQWVLGDWFITSKLAKASYPQAPPPRGKLGEGSLRSSEEKAGSEVTLAARFMADKKARNLPSLTCWPVFSHTWQ